MMTMTEKYKILGKYIKDMSSETPNIETGIWASSVSPTFPKDTHTPKGNVHHVGFCMQKGVPRNGGSSGCEGYNGTERHFVQLLFLEECLNDLRLEIPMGALSSTASG